MSLIQCILILVSLFLFISQSFAQSSDYKYYRALDIDAKFVLGWKYNDTYIDFEVTAQTTGYVGFGISKVGLMNPADLLIGWISQDLMYLGDYYTRSGSRTPYMDISQDWLLLEGSEQNGVTVLRFTRKLVTCDTDDEPITRDRLQLIWCYGREDPDTASGLVPYHGDTNRGSTDIFLLENDVVPANFPLPNTYLIPLKNHQYNIRATGVSLQCIVFDLSSLVPESHMIKYEPEITAGNEQFVYRMTLYRCNLISPSLNGVRFECENEAPTAVRSCKQVVASWSMGGQSFHFPNDVGIRMGGPDQPTTYVLEIQYSKYADPIDSNGKPVVIPDSSGLLLTYTTSAVTHSAGMLELGKVISPGWAQIIPETEAAFKATALCSPRCMNWGFSTDQTPIKAVAVMLKGNDVASEIKVRHYRGNEELPWIAVDRRFSNFYQAPRHLNNPITIKSTDTLSVECTYNTSSRTGITKGGWSRIEEVCRATIVYYPAKQFDMCLSWSSFDKLYDKNGTKIPENRAPAYLFNITQWDLPMKSLLRQALEQSSERSICSAVLRQPAYAIDRYNLSANIKQYREKLQC